MNVPRNSINLFIVYSVRSFECIIVLVKGIPLWPTICFYVWRSPYRLSTAFYSRRATPRYKGAAIFSAKSEFRTRVRIWRRKRQKPRKGHAHFRRGNQVNGVSSFYLLHRDRFNDHSSILNDEERYAPRLF